MFCCFHPFDPLSGRFLCRTRIGYNGVGLRQIAAIEAGAGHNETPAVDSASDSIEAKLKKLYALFEKGLVTRSEYEQQKLELLKNI